ncbi:hypothetical protein Tco_1172540 [Tanacetum coccineum]
MFRVIERGQGEQCTGCRCRLVRSGAQNRVGICKSGRMGGMIRSVANLQVDKDNTMLQANLTSAIQLKNEASPSYDSDILSEVHDHDHYQDAVCEHHEVHEMHDDVQPNYIVDSHADYTSDSNMIPYDQYVKDNAVTVVQSNVSSVLNDAYMMKLNDIYDRLPNVSMSPHITM